MDPMFIALLTLMSLAVVAVFCVVKFLDDRPKQGNLLQMIRPGFWSLWRIATKHDLKQLLDKLMSEITDFRDSINADFEKFQKGVDGIAEDVAFLKNEIANFPGTGLSNDDKAVLADIKARFGVLAAKVTALDEATESPIAPEPTAPV